MPRPPVALTFLALAVALAPWPGRAAGEGLLLRRPGAGPVPVAGDAPRQPQHRLEPDPRPLPRRAALGVRDASAGSSPPR